MISLYSAARIEQVAASEDKKIISYPTGHHMLHLEENSIRLQFMKDLIGWITQRTPPPALGQFNFNSKNFKFEIYNNKI